MVKELSLQELSERKYRSIEDFCRHLRALNFGVKRSKNRITIYMPPGHGISYEDTAYLMQQYSLCFDAGAQLTAYREGSPTGYMAHVTFLKRPPFYWHSPVDGKDMYGQKRK